MGIASSPKFGHIYSIAMLHMPHPSLVLDKNGVNIYSFRENYFQELLLPLLTDGEIETWVFCQIRSRNQAEVCLIPRPVTFLLHSQNTKWQLLNFNHLYGFTFPSRNKASNQSRFSEMSTVKKIIYETVVMGTDYA